MLSRTSFLVLHRIPALCASELMRRSVHTYVAADECILKQGEVYSTTATGTTEIGVRYLDLVKGDGEQCKKGIIKLIYC